MSAEGEAIVAVVRRNGGYHWFESERDLWVLDWNKWRQFFVDLGYETPQAGPEDRMGIAIVNDATATRFLAEMQRFEITQNELAQRLRVRYGTAASWWSVRDIFPILFVDFDSRRVAAFYSEGTPMERFIPDGWTGEFVDFAEELTIGERFWVQDGHDLLKALNDRGKNCRSVASDRGNGDRMSGDRRCKA